MAIIRPDKYPRYASVDIVDPTSGVNNVVEPSESKKDLGHGPKGEFPPRQYQNWFMRKVYQWIKYFDGDASWLTPFGCKILITDLTAQLDFDIQYSVVKDIIFIYVPSATGTSNSTSLDIWPVANGGKWPDELIGADNQQIPLLLISNGDGKVGIILCPKVNTSPFVCKFPNSSGVISQTGFANTGVKGVPRGTFVYKRDFI